MIRYVIEMKRADASAVVSRMISIAEKAMIELGESIVPTVSRGQDTADPAGGPGVSGEKSPARARGAPPERD